MIRRDAEACLRALASRHAAVTVTGPRQSGKTTLCRAAFPDHGYVSLERPDRRDEARADPLGLLARFPEGLLLDEVQHVPELLSYLQVEIDSSPRPGRYILTGSQHFGLLDSVSQSLAGRSAFLRLLPPSWNELSRFPAPPEDLATALWTGSYPAIHDRVLPADEWLSGYVASYVERDVRQVLEVRDLRAFQTFVRLCAGRTGQVLNMGSLGADAGVSAGTVRSWLGVLEASFLIKLVPGWYANPRKRLLKSPKLHFLDSGLACWLLGIRTPADLHLHHARGALFESWVVAEVLKSRLNRGRPADLFHVRNQKGEEIDLLVDDGVRLALVEAKSGQTIASDAFRALERWDVLLGADACSASASRLLVHGGTMRRKRGDIEVLPWEDLAEWEW